MFIITDLCEICINHSLYKNERRYVKCPKWLALGLHCLDNNHGRIQNFLKGGVGHRKAKKKKIMSIRCMFRDTMFSLNLRLVRLFSLANGGSVRVGGGGHDFCTRKSWVTIALLLSMKWGSGGVLPQKKKLISMKQNRAIFESLGLNIHCLKRVLIVN